MQRELDDVRAFLARYQLSEPETQEVYAHPSLTDDRMPAFLDTMERVQQVKRECKALASDGDVGCALELLDAVGKAQDVGFERLYAWTAKKCAAMDDSEPSSSLHRAIALLRDRPDFYKYVYVCVGRSGVCKGVHCNLILGYVCQLLQRVRDDSARCSARASVRRRTYAGRAEWDPTAD